MKIEKDKKIQQVLDQAREEFEKIAPKIDWRGYPSRNTILSWHTSTLKAFIEAEIARLKGMKLKINETRTQQVYKEWYDKALQDQITHLKQIKL